MQALQDMLSASQQDLEAFLTQVYRAIAGAAPLKDKVRPVATMTSLLLLHSLHCASHISPDNCMSDIPQNIALCYCFALLLPSSFNPLSTAAPALHLFCTRHWGLSVYKVTGITGSILDRKRPRLTMS